MDYQGLLYRAVDPRHWGEPLSGAGAAESGQRFNRKGEAALYTALRPQTVLCEKMQGGTLQPLLIVAINADLTGLFDARDPAELARFGLEAERLGRDDWAERGETHRLVAAVRAAGHPGMLVPSYARGAEAEDVNLVLWEWEGRLTVVDEDGCLAGLARNGKGGP